MCGAAASVAAEAPFGHREVAASKQQTAMAAGCRIAMRSSVNDCLRLATRIPIPLARSLAVDDPTASQDSRTSISVKSVAGNSLQVRKGALPRPARPRTGPDRGGCQSPRNGKPHFRFPLRRDEWKARRNPDIQISSIRSMTGPRKNSRPGGSCVGSRRVTCRPSRRCRSACRRCR